MMKIGDTATVIQHSITLVSGKSITIYQNPDIDSTPESIYQDIISIKETKIIPTLTILDIHGALHLLYINSIAHHSMKNVKIKIRAADNNPFNDNYGEDII